MHKKEKSCGAVVYTKSNSQIKYVIVKDMNGIFGFPKGHMEKGETELQTAKREVYEETGLAVKLLDSFRSQETYNLPNTEIQKQVIYFLGYFENQNFICQKEELSEILLLSYCDAANALQLEDKKQILREANEFLTKKHE